MGVSVAGLGFSLPLLGYLWFAVRATRGFRRVPIEPRPASGDDTTRPPPYGGRVREGGR